VTDLSIITIMAVTIDLEPHLDIVMEIPIEEVAIDVVLMVTIATTMMEENIRSSNRSHKLIFYNTNPFFLACLYLVLQKVS
jgi:hypothetical protein